MPSKICIAFAQLNPTVGDISGNLAALRTMRERAAEHGADLLVTSEMYICAYPPEDLVLKHSFQDSLPPYEILDGILECLIEQDLGMREIVAKGYDAATVAKIWSLLDKAEYKRRQAAPGVKITRRNLSRDRRYPITNKYRERTSTR